VKLLTIQKWDTNFFETFIDFRNRIHQSISTSFPETVDDYTRFFADDSKFIDDYSWVAFLVVEGDRVLAQAILTWRKDSLTANLGFLDWENNSSAAKFMMEAIKSVAKENNIRSLKTPVDLNFFVKYRIRLPGGEKPFWGEPVYPDYYHELFTLTGFREVGRWDSYRLKKIQGILDYFLKRKKLAVKPTGSHNKTKDKSLRTTVRCINMKDWDNELKIIYELFFEAYKSMPEWEPITYEQFKIIYDDFKYIINPWYAYIVELRGKPVGFSINFTDPLPVLNKVKGKKLSSFQKALVFLKLRMNATCFLIAHVGKIPGPNGEEIKGVQIQVSKRIQIIALFMKKVLVTFQMTNSPSRRSFESSSQSLYAQYVIYGLDLE
jgi:hypothetical protein